jgi:hypothetical protein
MQETNPSNQPICPHCRSNKNVDRISTDMHPMTQLFLKKATDNYVCSKCEKNFPFYNKINI